MNRENLKRLAATLLALAMVVTSVPSSAIAADVDGSTTSEAATSQETTEQEDKKVETPAEESKETDSEVSDQDESTSETDGEELEVEEEEADQGQYVFSGYVAWRQDVDKTVDLPTMEKWFNDKIEVTCNGEAYKAYKIDYQEDASKEKTTDDYAQKVYKFTIEGLNKVDADGKDCTYKVTMPSTDDYFVDVASMKDKVDDDTTVVGGKVDGEYNPSKKSVSDAIEAVEKEDKEVFATIDETVAKLVAEAAEEKAANAEQATETEQTDDDAQVEGENKESTDIEISYSASDINSSYKMYKEVSFDVDKDLKDQKVVMMASKAWENELDAAIKEATEKAIADQEDAEAAEEEKTEETEEAQVEEETKEPVIEETVPDDLDLVGDGADDAAATIDAFDGSAKLQAVWLDSTTDVITPRDYQGATLVCTYKLADGTTGTIKYSVTTSGDDWTVNGLDADPYFSEYADKFAITCSGETVLNKTFSLSGLPSKMTVENPSDPTKTLAVDLSWDLQMTNAPKSGSNEDGSNNGPYVMNEDSSSSAGNRVYDMTPTVDVVITVDMKSGADDDKTAFLDALKKGTLALEASNGNTDCSSDTYTGSDGQSHTYGDSNLTYGSDFTYDPETGKLTIKSVPFAKVNSKEEITYKITYTENAGVQSSDHYYYPTYDNTKVSNFGTQIDATYNDANGLGILRLTKAGFTKYTGTKVWEDDDDSQGLREGTDTEWTLYRYSDSNGSNYTTASPVKYTDSGERNIGRELEYDDTEEVSWTYLTTDDSKKVLTNQLPKYDTDGYEYVYFAKEEMGNRGEYVTEFGTVDENGSTVTTVTNDSSQPGDYVPASVGQRDSTDQSIYNGGTVVNRLQKDTTVTLKKTWKAENYQSDISEVYVLMALQCRKAGSEDEWVDAKDADGKTITKGLDGFIAERLTQTASTSAPAYDSKGVKLEYKWVEAGVYENKDKYDAEDPDQNNLLDKETMTFNVTNLNDEDTATGQENLKDGPEWFYSDEEDGVVTNRLKGYTDYLVQKNWTDESLIDNAEEDENGKYVGIYLHQLNPDGTDNTSYYYKVYEKDGWELHIKYLPDGDTGIQKEEAGNELPKYNEDGGKYTYMALEADSSAFLPSYNYGEGKYDDPAASQAVITNGPGEGAVIKVRKRWIDDGDGQSRKAVSFDVYRVPAGTDVTTLDDNSLGDYDLVATDQKVTAGMNWWRYVNVTGFPLDEDKDGTNEYEYYVHEVTVGEGTVDYNSKSSNDLPTVTTGENLYKYEVMNTVTTDDLGFYCVTNRRIGTVDLKATKKWLDGANDTGDKDALAAKRAQLNAQAKVTIDNSNGAIAEIVEEDGVSYVVIGGDGVESIKVPITDTSKAGTSEGNYNKDGSNLNVKDTQAVPTDLTVGETSSDEESVYFCNLPKYDLNGKVIVYNLTETMDEAKAKELEYTSSSSAGDYTVESGVAHIHDYQEVAFTNSLSATKDVRFYKYWIDKNVKEEGHRPDIYLTLYYVDSTCKVESNPTTTDIASSVSYVPKQSTYVERKWDKEKEDGTYEWSVQFDNMPKYDSNGYLITYYATESTHVDTDTLEYLPVQYSMVDTDSTKAADHAEKAGYDDGTYDSIKYKQSGDSFKFEVTHNPSENASVNETSDVVRANDGAVVLKENGTFVNEIGNYVRVKGQKVWENLPEGFDLEDLPSLNFKLYQYTDADCTQNEKEMAYVDIEESTDENFSFAMQYTGKNNEKGQQLDAEGKVVTYTEDTIMGHLIPRYDSTGARYYYAVKETGNDEILALRENKTLSEEGTSGYLNNRYTITNTYQDGKSKLTVSKKWYDKNDQEITGEKVPEITLELYRFYKKDNGNYSKATLVESQKYDCTNEESVTFDELNIIAANNSPYYYYLVERTVSGYTVKSITINTSDAVKTAEASPAEGKAPSVDTTTDAYASTKAFYFNSENQTDEVNASIDLENKANDEEKVWLDGGKLFTGDYDNSLNTRQGTLTFNVYHYADKQNTKGGSNAIAPASIGTFEVIVAGKGKDVTYTLGNVTGDLANSNIKITITKVNDANFTYKITDQDGNGCFDKYSPNGNPWKYKAVEELSTKQKEVYDTAGGSDQSTDDDGNVSLQYFYNTYKKTKRSVEKKWYDSKGNEIAWYISHKLTANVKLQVKDTAVDNDWHDAKDFFSTNYNVTITKDTATLTNYPDNFKATFSDLPKGRYATVSDTESWYDFQYRIVETSVTDSHGKTTTFDDDDWADDIGTAAYESGSYKVEFSNVNTSTETIKNTYTDKLIDFTIKKAWDDENNKYDTRCSSIQMSLQRTTDAPGAESRNWQEVLTKTWDGQSEWKVADLPVYAPDGTSVYYYRVEEKSVTNVETAVSTNIDDADSALTNNDGTMWSLVKISGQNIYYPYQISYNNTSNIDTSSDEVTEITASVKNKLTEDYRDIQVTKQWLDEDGNPLGSEEIKNLSVYFEVLYSVDGGKNYKSFTKRMTAKADQSNNWTVNFTDLIKWYYTSADFDSQKDVMYKVVEYADSNLNKATDIKGFWKVEGADGQAVATDDTEVTFNNERTAFGLDKKVNDPAKGSDYEDMDKTVVLQIKDSSGKAVLNWQRVPATSGTAASYSITMQSTDAKYANVKLDSDNKIVGLPLGKYTLTEPASLNPDLDAYLLIPDFTFTISSKGTISGSSASGTSSVVITGGSNVSNILITANDVKIRGKVNIVKTLKDGSDTSKLAGVTFGLWYYAGTGTDYDNLNKYDPYMNGDDQYTVTTDENGNASFENLPVGHYYFKETAVPEDVTLDTTEHTFTIERNSKTPTVQVADQKFDISNKPFTRSLELEKKDAETKDPVVGAKFDLYKCAEGTEIDRDKDTLIKKDLVTDNDGKIKVEGLKIGSYYFVETYAPAKYLFKENTVTEVKTFTGGTVEDTTPITFNTVTNTPFESKVEFTKLDGYTGKALAGVTFNLLKDGKVVDTAVTDEDGKVEFEIDEAGSYTVAESEEDYPSNYVYSPYTAKFDVENTESFYKTDLVLGETKAKSEVKDYQGGGRKVTAATTDDYKLEVTGHTILDGTAEAADANGKLVNYPKTTGSDYELRIKKVETDESEDNGIGKKLDGAIFTITPNGKSTFADGTTEAKEVKATDGTINLKGIINITDTEAGTSNSYTITEKSAPTGHIAYAGSLKVEVVKYWVDKDGEEVKGKAEGGITQKVRLLINDKALDEDTKSVDDGNVIVTKKEEQTSTSFNADFVAYVKNDLTTFGIDKKKVDSYTGKSSDAETMDDVTLKVTDSNNNDAKVFLWSRKDGVVSAEISDDYPTIEFDATNNVFKGMPAGSYKLTETWNHDQDYLFIPETEFTVSADGKVTLAGESESVKVIEVAGVKEAGLEATDVRVRGNVILTKYYDAENGNDPTALEGVTFALYKVTKDGDVKIADGLKTDAKGQINLRETSGTFIAGEDSGENYSVGLLTGKYYFVETATVKGKALDDTHHEFEIKVENGAIKQPETVQVDNIINKDNSFDITKISSDKNYEIPDGAEFEILDSNGDSLDPKVTGTTKDGKITFKGQIEGYAKTTEATTEYILRETKAPVGYALAEDVNFHMSLDGKLYKDSTEAKAITGNNITVEDTPIYLTVGKFAATDASQIIEGVKFDVLDANKKETGISGTTNSDGQIDLTAKLTGSKEGTVYYLHEDESTVPEPYKVIASDIKFTVYADGTIVAANTDRVDAILEKATGTDVNKYVLSVLDPEVETAYMQLKKTNLYNEPLDGVEFKITDANGEKVVDDLTGTDGIIDLKDELEKSVIKVCDLENVDDVNSYNYTLTEVATKTGYQIPAFLQSGVVFRFEMYWVDKDGKEVKGRAEGGITRKNRIVIVSPDESTYRANLGVYDETVGSEAVENYITIQVSDPDGSPEKGKITVTKKLQELNQDTLEYEDIISNKEKTFYVALFRDEAGKNRVSEVKAISWAGKVSESVTFDKLPQGTYYVYETDESGKAIHPYATATVTDTDSTMSYSVDVEKDETETIKDGGESAQEIDLITTGPKAQRVLEANVLLQNQYVDFPDEYYNVAYMNIKKVVKQGSKVLKAKNVKKKFYAKVTAPYDPDITNPDGTPYEKIVEITPNKVTRFEVPLRKDKDNPSVTFVVVECDKNGNELSSGDNGYKITMTDDNVEASWGIEGTTAEVTITKANGETSVLTITNSKPGKKHHKHHTKTGDSTPIGLYVVLMILALTEILLLLKKKGLLFAKKNK